MDTVISIDINNPPINNGPLPSCLLSFLARIYFISFVMVSEYVLINIVVAVLLKHLEVFQTKWFIFYLIIYIFSNQDLDKIEMEKKEMDTEIFRQLSEKEFIQKKDSSI